MSATMSSAAWLSLLCGIIVCQGFMPQARGPDESAGSAAPRVSSGAGGTGHQPQPDVRISVSVSEHLVTLSCDVTGVRAGSDDHRVQFFCPLLPASVQCFGDCSPMCSMQTDGRCLVADRLLAGDAGAVACRASAVSPDAKSVRLTVDTRWAPLAGRWGCKFRGAASASVELTQFLAKSKEEEEAEAPPPPIESPDSVAAPHRPASITRQPAWPDQLGLGVWKPDAPRYEASDAASTGAVDYKPTVAQFARTNYMYIIGVLTIMTVSLLLNIGFCLRCILAKLYIELRKRNQRQPLGRLASCLCVSTVQVSLDSIPDAAAEAPAGKRGGGGSLPAPASAASAASDAGPAASHRIVDRPQRHDRQHHQPHHNQLAEQNLRCAYCLQPDCRILLDAESSCPCGSSACSTNEAAFGQLEAAATGPDDGEVAAGAAAEESQADSESNASSACSPSRRLQLSRRMLRKADTLLREANSLLLETECASGTTDLEQQQHEQ